MSDVKFISTSDLAVVLPPQDGKPPNCLLLAPIMLPMTGSAKASEKNSLPICLVGDEKKPKMVSPYLIPTFATKGAIACIPGMCLVSIKKLDDSQKTKHIKIDGKPVICNDTTKFVADIQVTIPAQLVMPPPAPPQPDSKTSYKGEGQFKIVMPPGVVESSTAASGTKVELTASEKPAGQTEDKKASPKPEDKKKDTKKEKDPSEPKSSKPSPDQAPPYLPSEPTPVPYVYVQNPSSVADYQTWQQSEVQRVQNNYIEAKKAPVPQPAPEPSPDNVVDSDFDKKFNEPESDHIAAFNQSINYSFTPPTSMEASELVPIPDAPTIHSPT